MNEEIKKLIESVDMLSPEDIKIQARTDKMEGYPERSYIELSDFDMVVKELTDWNKVEDKLPKHIPVLCKTKTDTGGNQIYFVGYYEPITGYFYDANRVYRLVTEWKPII